MLAPSHLLPRHMVVFSETRLTTLPPSPQGQGPNVGTLTFAAEADGGILGDTADHSATKRLNPLCQHWFRSNQKHFEALQGSLHFGL